MAIACSTLILGWHISVVKFTDYIYAQFEGVNIIQIAKAHGVHEEVVEIVEMTYEEVIRSVAKNEGFENADLLVHIAQCESGDRDTGLIRPDIPNPYSSALGAFQYLSGTWLEGAHQMREPWGLEDRTDLTKATRMAIHHINKGYLRKWNASKSCWK